MSKSAAQLLYGPVLVIFQVNLVTVGLVQEWEGGEPAFLISSLLSYVTSHLPAGPGQQLVLVTPCIASFAILHSSLR